MNAYSSDTETDNDNELVVESEISLSVPYEGGSSPILAPIPDTSKEENEIGAFETTKLSQNESIILSKNLKRSKLESK